MPAAIECAANIQPGACLPGSGTWHALLLCVLHILLPTALIDLRPACSPSPTDWAERRACTGWAAGAALQLPLGTGACIMMGLTSGCCCLARWHFGLPSLLNQAAWHIGQTSLVCGEHWKYPTDAPLMHAGV